MIFRLILTAALAAGLSSAAAAQSVRVVPGCSGYTAQAGALIIDETGKLCVSGGGGGSSGSVTAPGTSGTQAQAVQGIAGGVPQNVSSAGVDSVVNAYTVTAAGAQTGVQTAGFGSALLELLGTFSATVQVQASSDSTDGVNGTWTALVGYTPEDNGGTSPTTALNTGLRKRLYRAQDGVWIRVNTSAYTSGTITAILTRRVASIAERGVYVGNSVALGPGASVIGSTTQRAAGTNRSATVNTTAANLMAANATRQGWKVKNDCANAIWINFDGTAAAAAGSGNIKIAAGGYLASEPGFVETGAMSAIAETSACAVTAREH